MTIETLNSESYATASGRQMTLVHARKDERTFTYETPIWREFWTYADEKGWGPSLGHGDNLHVSREAAIERLETEDRIETLANAGSSPLSRDEYEAACRRAGVETFSDADLLTSYGVRHGEFYLPRNNADTIIRMTLARRRQMAVEDEEAARRTQSPEPQIEMATCQRCGTEVSRVMLMSASLGTTCPDCYDAWSDGEGYGR